MKTMDFKNFVYFRSCYALNMAKKDKLCANALMKRK